VASISSATYKAFFSLNEPLQTHCGRKLRTISTKTKHHDPRSWGSSADQGNQHVNIHLVSTTFDDADVHIQGHLSMTPHPAAQTMSDLNAPAPFAKRTYGGISGEERSRQRREKLLESSLDVFGTLGHDKATMRDICAHARLAERYFYENFANTAEAFEAVYLMLSRQLFEALAQAVSKTPENHAMGKAAACLRTYFSFIKEDPRRAQIMLLDAPRLGHNNIHQAGSTMADYAQFMVGIVRGHQHDLPARVNLDLVATGLIGLAAQTGITWYHSDFKASVDQLVEHNLYAWHGLAHWLDRQRTSQDQPA